MAEKIILELKDKDIFSKWYAASLWESQSKNNQKVSTHDKTMLENVKSTLVNMWYNSKDIDRVLAELPAEMYDVWEVLPWVIARLG
jgi:Holliday junction resolvasome RuvABC DNA-binding subunit